jgi:hypothetical protein
MSVSAELLCSFELLKPLDSTALKSHIKKGRNMRNNLLNSPVSPRLVQDSAFPMLCFLLTLYTACCSLCPKLLVDRRLTLFEISRMLCTPAHPLLV